MRLWHSKLIKVLPRQQLIAQWRECSAIVGKIQKTGSPNHVLVNFIMDYDFTHFIEYSSLVRLEMISRGYNPSDKVWEKIQSIGVRKTPSIFIDIYPEIMNEEYYQICYYNLYEKYLRGGIVQKEWDLIKNNS